MGGLAGEVAPIKRLIMRIQIVLVDTDAHPSITLPRICIFGVILAVPRQDMLATLSMRCDMAADVQHIALYKKVHIYFVFLLILNSLELRTHGLLYFGPLIWLFRQ